MFTPPPPLAVIEQGSTRDCDVCMEEGKGTPQQAVSVCSGCGDALCDRHNKGNRAQPECTLCYRMARWV